MPRRARWLLLPLALAAGCPDSCDEATGPISYYPSESGRWHLRAAGLVADPCDAAGLKGPEIDEPLLVGTRWCPAIECVDEAPCSDLAPELLETCYARRVEGPATLTDECLKFTGSGEVVFHLDQIPCAELGMLFPERFTLRSVTADEVQGRIAPYLDQMAVDYLAPLTGEFPVDALRPKDATLLKLAADEPVHMAVNLWAGDSRVAWSAEQATLDVEVVRGEPSVALERDTMLALRFPEGSEAALTLVVGANRIALGRVRGVGLDTLQDLEVVVAYGQDPNFTVLPIPLGARAVARDRDGDLVYGARAEWEVLAGSFAFSQFPLWAAANYDYTLLIDTVGGDEGSSLFCFPTPSTGVHDYTGRITARVAGLGAEADLAWTYQAPNEDLEGIFADALKPLPPGPNCEGPGFDEPACECSAAPQGGTPLCLLVLLALGAARRRRP